MHSNFGGGSKNHITNSNSSFVDNIIYPSPKASPSTPPVKREGDGIRENIIAPLPEGFAFDPPVKREGDGIRENIIAIECDIYLYKWYNLLTQINKK